MRQLEIRNHFPAKTDNFWETMMSHSAGVGFRVPEYQRRYNWNQEQIKRLLEDCLNGFYYLSESNNKDKYTFLATIILVLEESEHSFDGTSLSIVDGQQRLTTLVLVCCALIEKLLFHYEKDVELVKPETAIWIKEEVKHVCQTLFSCVIGHLPGRGETFPFPRIVREDHRDRRASIPTQTEYHSITAKFLMKFEAYYRKVEPSFHPPSIREDDVNEELFLLNYQYIKEQVDRLYNDDPSPENTAKKELEYEQVQKESFKKAKLLNLFEKLNVLQEEGPQDSAINDISKNPNSSGLIRLLLFSHYLMKCTIFTRVETKDEDSAFDIFDALNTTGEPLTALETFKPRIMHFENKSSGYHGSESEQSFERIEKYLNDIYKETEKRQNATKDLLITFALYLESYRLSRDLASQRAYLRNTFDKVEEPKKKRKVVESLADIAEFRHKYWNLESIYNLSTSNPERDNILKLCCRFIIDMKTSMALPILARYWVEYGKNNTSIDTFVDSVKAVTAFLVLRRSVTGGTGNIDTDFRKIIKGNPQNNNKPFCVGSEHLNSLPSVQDLKTTLQKYLDAPRIGVSSKETWINKVSKRGLAEHSASLCRFLLFAASHNAKSNPRELGLLTRKDIISSPNTNFLSFENWNNEKYATVEHITPQSLKRDTDWDPAIYENPYTRNTIGNLILLPENENSTIGNSSWKEKKLFYSALSSDKHTIRETYLSKAKKEGVPLNKTTKKLMETRERLYMLVPLTKVKKWDKKFIERRTENILELAWEEIAPWLSY